MTLDDVCKLVGLQASEISIKSRSFDLWLDHNQACWMHIDLVKEQDAVFLMLPDPNAIRHIAFYKGNVLHCADGPALYIYDYEHPFYDSSQHPALSKRYYFEGIEVDGMDELKAAILTAKAKSNMMLSQDFGINI